eukprot:GHVN01069944.1.p1 GENE.GHVN01069944.1~~GHVN01069944.1.p1  ORF type:complete len:689 (+),score=131.78 GHVN01069944.1:2201-4267(+)
MATSCQVVIKNARRVVNFPFGPSSDQGRQAVKAPSLFVTFQYNGQRYRTETQQETFQPNWGEKFQITLRDDAAPDQHKVLMEVVDATDNTSLAGAELDLNMPMDGQFSLRPNGFISMSVTHLPEVDDMYVPGWPVYSTAPLVGYKGTVCLPESVLQQGGSKYPPVLTKEGEEEARRRSGARSVHSHQQQSVGRYPSSVASHKQRGVYGGDVSGRGVGNGSQQGSRSRGIPEGFKVPKETISKVMELLDNQFDFETVIERYLSTNQNINETIDTLLEDRVANLAKEIGERNITKLACDIPQQTSRAAPQFDAYGNTLPQEASDRPEHSFLKFVNQPPPPTHPHQNYGPQTIKPAETDLTYEHSGFKRSLLVGVNYFNTRAELAGCIHDVKRIKSTISQLYRFPTTPERMTVLTDDNKDKRFHPTRANILNGFRWLTSDAQPGDALFFHFSGHGAQVPTKNAYEKDGLDETILPCDWERAGMILDEELHETLVEQLPTGVKLVCVMDCCHSATAIDLSHHYDKPSKAFKPYDNPFFSSNDTLLLSGSRDDQTSADVGGNDKYNAGGAMTMALISTLTSNPYDLSTDDLMQQLHQKLQKNGFPQRPQLSATQNFDTREKFSFTKININQNDQIGRLNPKPITTILPPSKSNCCSCGTSAASKKIDPTTDVISFVYNQLMGLGLGLQLGPKE